MTTENIDVEKFWVIYELLYSPEPNEAAQGLKMVQALPFKEDIEQFEAFKNAADRTEGTIGYQFNKLFQLQHEQNRLNAEKENIAKQKQELIDDQAHDLEEKLRKSIRP